MMIYKINPFKNRILFCLLPVIYCMLSAVHNGAMYATVDDWEMRSFISGYIGGEWLEPSPFSLYSSIFYGYFLNFFYLLLPKYPWYDLFTYLFCSFSLFVIIYFLTKNFEEDSLVKKTTILIVTSLVFSIYFIAPQFSQTSGILTIAGITAYYLMVSEELDLKHTIIYGLISFLCLLFASFIRFEVFLLVSFFLGVIFLPFWPYHNWKKRIWHIVFFLLQFLVILTFYYYFLELSNNNNQFKQLLEFNKLRLEVTDKTNMWDHVKTPWITNEHSLDEVENPDFNFSKADYRLLLVGAFGNQDVYNVDNMKKIVEAIKANVQEVNNIFSRVLVADYRTNFIFYVYLFLLLTLASLKNLKFNLFAAFVFFSITWILNIKFRPLPPRVWYNLVFCILIAILYNSKFRLPKNFLVSVLFLAFVGSLSYYSTHQETAYTKFRHNIYNSFKYESNFLSQDNLYIFEWATADTIIRPFSRRTRLNMIHLTPLGNYYKTYEEILNKYDISLKHPWEDISKPDSKVRFLVCKKMFNAPSLAIQQALKYYFKEKYDSEVMFLGDAETENFVSYKLYELSEQEIKMRNDFEEAISNGSDLFWINILKWHNIPLDFYYALRQDEWSKRDRLGKILFIKKFNPYLTDSEIVLYCRILNNCGLWIK